MRFGNYPSYHICKTLGLIPKSCFSLLWDQSQLQPVHDIGTDPKTLFFITLGSIPTMDCTWHWDWSQSPIFWPLGLIPMWHLDSVIQSHLNLVSHSGFQILDHWDHQVFWLLSTHIHVQISIGFPGSSLPLLHLTIRAPVCYCRDISDCRDCALPTPSCGRDNQTGARKARCSKGKLEPGLSGV